MNTEPIKGDPVKIEIATFNRTGRRVYTGTFIRWLKGYRAKVLVDGREWTVGGLAVTKIIGKI